MSIGDYPSAAHAGVSYHHRYLVPVRLGILGLGSVYWTPYRTAIERLAAAGRVEVTAAYDPDPEKRAAADRPTGAAVAVGSAEAVIEHDRVDAVLVLTSMLEHGRLGLAALEAGRHVLVEKPMATTMDEARALVAAAGRSADRALVCPPAVLLSPTYRAVHRRVVSGDVGRVVLARARYGWAGPWWGRWYYEPGGGALFDLGIYNVTSLCGMLGPVRRVAALVGTAIPDRIVEGAPIRVRSDDNAHLLLDFGESRFASVTTGFTMQRYRSPAIELYGTDGVVQMLGDDWAPEGFEVWRNDAGAWEVHPESAPGWSWTAGLDHLVDCIERGVPPAMRPEHSLHALEVMLAARRSSEEGRAVDLETGFPAPDYSLHPPEDGGERRVHDPRSVL
jgi:predicted dehydrogenase